MVNFFEDYKTRKDFIKAGLASAGLFAAAACSSTYGKIIPPINYNRILRLKNCNVIDTLTGRVLPDKTVTIRNGKFLFIENNNDRMDDLGKVIDLGGRYLLPGLIDAHCHMTLPGASELNMLDGMDNLRQMKDNFIKTIESGVTTVRDMGSFTKYLKDRIEDINEGSLPGPRVVFCNSMLNINGGHPSIKSTDISFLAYFVEPVLGEIATHFNDLDELKEILNKITEDGNFIKLTMDNESLIAGKDKLRAYKDEHLKYIFNFAEKKELTVSGHVMYKWGFRRACRYPIHSVEHIVCDYELDESDIETMVRKNISIVPTLVLGNIYATKKAYKSLPEKYRTDFIEREIKIRKAYWKSISDKDVISSIHENNIESISWYKESGYNFKKLIDENKYTVKPDPFFNLLINGRKNIMKMKDAGVLIGCGTDAGVPSNYHGKFFRELEIMSRFGFSNGEILRCATINNARIIGMHDSLGRIEPGKTADCIVLNKNPLKEISACRGPVMVIKDGKIAYVPDKSKIRMRA